MKQPTSPGTNAPSDGTSPSPTKPFKASSYLTEEDEVEQYDRINPLLETMEQPVAKEAEPLLKAFQDKWMPKQASPTPSSEQLQSEPSSPAAT